MIETILINYPYYGYFITASLVAIKLVNFNEVRNENPKHFNLLFYPRNNIIQTKDLRKQKFKRNQNLLTTITIIVALTCIAHRILFYK
jgi:hypothetical protein